MLALMLASAAVLAQENNLYTDDGAVKWQRIYEASQSGAAIVKALKLDGRFSEVEQLDSNTIVAKLENYEIDYKEQGYTKWNVPMYFSMQKMSAQVLINLKQGRYRVTLYNIVFEQTKTVSEIYTAGETYAIEEYALRKDGSFRGGFHKTANIFDVDFGGLFGWSAATSDDW